MAALPIVYSAEYNVPFPGREASSTKYARIIERLVADGTIDAASVTEPEYANEQDLRLVHSREYLKKLRSGMLRLDEAMLLEAPWSPALVRATWRAAEGTIVAARRALDTGLSVHVGGGFGHAFAEHGEFFCLVNDTAVATCRLMADGAIQRALLVNCDVHQANGTAHIFANEPLVTTFSVHQENNYPYTKQHSDCDVALYEGTGATEYMHALRTHLPRLLEAAQPSIVFYVAGADVYVKDYSGGLGLTRDEIAERDRYVIETVRAAGIPLVISLGGGEAQNPDDTIEIHARTVALAAERASQERLVTA